MTAPKKVDGYDIHAMKPYDFWVSETAALEPGESIATCTPERREVIARWMNEQREALIAAEAVVPQRRPS